MTPTHTMRIPVRAWRCGPNGELPEDALMALERVNGLGKGRSPKTGGPALFVPILTVRIDAFECWYWDDHIARPGDWIVESSYGLEAMTDAEFRERCIPEQN